MPLNLATNTGASVANGGVLTISGRVSGGGALTKNGNGTLVLANSNGYGPAAGSVGTTLNAGILQVGNNAALSTGDVSVAGNSTIQAGANGLVLNNNLVIGAGNTATIDTQGNTLTLAGLVSESAPSGSLAAIGGGTLVLTNSNTYTGTTTITSATLQLDNGGSTGYVGGPIVDNGTLALDRGDAGLLLSSVISGTGSLSQIGAGVSTLNAANTFNGNTTISAGTLQLANSLGLQNSTLVLNNPNGTLSFGTLTAATLGALSGSQALSLLNTSGAAVALTVGNNGLSTTYSGGLSDAGAGASLTAAGPATFTLTGSSSLSGATNVNAGALVVASGGVLSTSAANVANVATLSVAGGTFNSSAASAIGTRNVGGGVFSMSAGAANFNGGVALQNADGGLISITGGSLSALSITLPRTSQPGASTRRGNSAHDSNKHRPLHFRRQRDDRHADDRERQLFRHRPNRRGDRDCHRRGPDRQPDHRRPLELSAGEWRIVYFHGLSQWHSDWASELRYCHRLGALLERRHHERPDHQLRHRVRLGRWDGESGAP